MTEEELIKEWHKYYCVCKGSMKDISTTGAEIRCPVYSFQDFKRRATDNVNETVLDFLKKVKVIND